MLVRGNDNGSTNNGKCGKQASTRLGAGKTTGGIFTTELTFGPNTEMSFGGANIHGTGNIFRM